MKNLTFKQLRYFDAVRKTKKFRAAAENCAISQPALSMQIKDLEETVGLPLLERDTRHVHLTRHGEEFAERATEILRSIDELGEWARASQDDLGGRLNLGIIPTIAPYILPGIIGNLNKSALSIDLYVRESQTSNLISELQDGKLDLAILALPISEPMLTEIALFEENFVLVRPVSDQHKPVPDIDQLGVSDSRLFLLEEGHCFREQALSFCSSSVLSSNDSLDGSSLTTLVQMVALGLGITVIPEMAIGVETKSMAVDVCEFADPVPSRTIGMVWRKSSPQAKQFMQIADIVKKSVI